MKTFIRSSLFLFFLLCWVLPFSWVGAMRKIPRIDHLLNTCGVPEDSSNTLYRGAGSLWRISCLFSHSSQSWGNVYYQLRLDGEEEWTNLTPDFCFKMKPFGYRYRPDYLFSYLGRDEARKKRLYGELAIYVRNQFQTRFPDRPKVEELKLVRVRIPVGHDLLVKRTGHWKIHPLEDVPDNYKVEHAVIDFTGEHQRPEHTTLTASESFHDEHLLNLIDKEEIKSLDLSDSYISDRSAPAFLLFSNLETLSVANTTIGKDVITSLSKLHSLHTLDLSRTITTDDDVKQLIELSTLKQLDLSHTRITPLTLRHLAHLQNLSEVKLKGTSLSKTAIEELRSSNPALTIIRK